MNYQTHTDGIKGMRSRIEKSMENGVLYRNLNHDLINELNETGLLKLLIRKRVELLIENQIQNEGKTKQEFFHECFGPRVENFYLDKKEKNETIDFKILRNNKKNVMLEAHQRLINKESQWVELSDKWGIEPEKRSGGKLLNIKQNQLNSEILTMLKNIQEGAISEVFRSGKEYAVVELIKWKEIKLTDDIEKQLLKEMGDEWIDKLAREVEIKCLEGIHDE